MIHVKWDETRDKTEMEINGCLGQICAELGLVIKVISINKEVDISVDEMFCMIKKSINENIENVRLK